MVSIGCQQDSEYSLTDKLTFPISQVHEFSANPRANSPHIHFCIPAYPMLAEQVRQIDPNITILDPDHPENPCPSVSYHCMANLPLEDADRKIKKWARLNYVQRIELITSADSLMEVR